MAWSDAETAVVNAAMNYYEGWLAAMTPAVLEPRRVDLIRACITLTREREDKRRKD